MKASPSLRPSHAFTLKELPIINLAVTQTEAWPWVGVAVGFTCCGASGRVDGLLQYRLGADGMGQVVLAD